MSVDEVSNIISWQMGFLAPTVVTVTVLVGVTAIKTVTGSEVMLVVALDNVGSVCSICSRDLRLI